MKKIEICQGIIRTVYVDSSGKRWKTKQSGRFEAVGSLIGDRYILVEGKEEIEGMGWREGIFNFCVFHERSRLSKGKKVYEYAESSHNLYPNGTAIEGSFACSKSEKTYHEIVEGSIKYPSG